MSDVVKEILAFNAGRDPVRLAIKYARMCESPSAFMRGSAHLYNAWLPKAGLLFDAPRVWACGDLHLENFGSYKADNRLVHFDINDFDDALLAPAGMDLLRLLTSALVSAEVLDIAAEDAGKLCREALSGYVAALTGRKPLWVERETAKGVVADLLESLRSRSREDFLDSRTDLAGEHRSLRVDGRKALPVSKSERKMLEALMADFATTQPDPHFFSLIDAARRISGNGSLGVTRYILLVRGKGGPAGNYLLDLKEARPSSLARQCGLPQPAWADEAERVVRVQACMQANSIALLHAVKLDGRAAVLRELQPAQDRVDLQVCRGRPGRLRGLLETEACVLGWAQLRASGHYGSACADELVAFAERSDWQQPLLALAAEAAREIRRNWQDFAKACAAGVVPMPDESLAGLQENT